MLLAIDVGNTETKLGIFEDGARIAASEVARYDRVTPHAGRIRRLFHAAL